MAPTADPLLHVSSLYSAETCNSPSTGPCSYPRRPVQLGRVVDQAGTHITILTEKDSIQKSSYRAFPNI